jgi:hypothetical protein
MSDSAGNVAEFESVEYTTEGGPDLGLGLHERETRLRIDLKTRVAFANSHQPTSDQGGEALGTFRTTLTPEVVAQIQVALAHADLSQIAAGTGGGPGTSVIQIRAKRGADSQTATFASRDMETLAKLQTLTSLLDDATFATSQHPFQAIRLELETTKAAGFAFTIKVKNVGTETVAIPDLEALGQESKDIREHGLGVRVATLPPARPGYTDPPLLWSRVALTGARKPAGKPVLLPPGGEQTVHTATWSDKGHAGRIYVQGFYAFYDGPPVIDGHLMIRGHALSAGVDVAQAHTP